MEKIKLPGNKPNQVAGSIWVLGNMQFNVPLSDIAALNEMWAAASMLRDRKDVYRHQMKRYVNRAIEQGDLQKALLMHYMNDADVMDEFTDHIVDVTAADVKALRDCLREKMQAHGIKEAELVAWVETARLLMILSVQHFNSIIVHAQRIFQCDYLMYFRKLRMDSVRDAWHAVANAIDPHPELTVEDDVLEKLKAISLHYAKGDYLKACIDLMREHPFFAGVQVEVEDFDNKKV